MDSGICAGYFNHRCVSDYVSLVSTVVEFVEHLISVFRVPVTDGDKLNICVLFNPLAAALGIHIHGKVIVIVVPVFKPGLGFVEDSEAENHRGGLREIFLIFHGEYSAELAVLCVGQNTFVVEFCGLLGIELECIVLAFTVFSYALGGEKGIHDVVFCHRNNSGSSVYDCFLCIYDAAEGVDGASFVPLLCKVKGHGIAAVEDKAVIGAKIAEINPV